jgi:hypothetical protein
MRYVRLLLLLDLHHHPSMKEGKIGNKPALKALKRNGLPADLRCAKGVLLLIRVTLWRNFLCVHFASCFLQSDLARVVQSALFVSGINTLIQTFLGSRLPTVMGNSFYFLPVILSIVNSPRIMNIGEPHEVLTTTVGSSPVLYNISFSSLICYRVCVY